MATFGTTVFQYWDNGAFHDYETRLQALLRAAFLEDPPSAGLDIGTYYIYGLGAIEHGRAFQRNKSTGYERPIRLQPPFRLVRNGNGGSNGNVPAAVTAVLDSSNVPELLSSLPENLQDDPSIQWEQQGVWTNFEISVVNEICRGLVCRPIPCGIMLRVDGYRYFLEDLEKLLERPPGGPPGFASLVNDRNQHLRAKVRTVLKPSFWNFYSTVVSDSLGSLFDTALGSKTSSSTVFGLLGSFASGPFANPSPFLEFQSSITSVVSIELLKTIKSCEKYPREGSCEVEFELVHTFGACFHRKKNGKTQIGSSKDSIGGSKSSNHILKVTISNLARLEEGKAEVKVVHWEETLTPSNTTDANGMGKQGQGTTEGGPFANNTALFAGNSSLFAGNSTLFASNSSFQSQGASSSSAIVSSSFAANTEMVRKEGETTATFELELNTTSSRNDIPYADGSIQLPGGLQIPKTVSVDNCSVPLPQLSNPPCTICLDDSSDACVRLECGHDFHKSCLALWLKTKQECPICKKSYGTVTGNQPENGVMEWQADYSKELGGFRGKSGGTIMVTFNFPSGVAEGQRYQARVERGFLPLNLQGIFLLELFKVAFRRRLMFGLGMRLTMQVFAPTFNIHLKTTAHPVGRERHGYPDEDYFQRTMDELSANKIFPTDLK